MNTINLPGKQDAWIQTYTGGVFHPFNPQPEEVHILDIAHALANTCRYGGHTLRFYSVAEHCALLAAYFFANNDTSAARLALLHDAAEAYVMDVPSPIKPYIGGYATLEANIEVAVLERFGMFFTPPSVFERVTAADRAILHNEKTVLMAPCDKPWNLPGQPLDLPVEVAGLLPDGAKGIFLSMFKSLFPEHAAE